MQTKFYFTLILIAGFTLTACNNGQKNETLSEDVVVTEEDNGLQPDLSSATVQWTAFKTTEKVPVKGHFTEIELSNFREGNTLEEVLDHVQFKLNAFKSDTEDPDRDETIKKNFFEKMMEPGSISGKFVYASDGWYMDIKMNGVNVKLPVEIDFVDNLAQLSATLDLNDFKALNALKALNDACHDLHMGGDGVSKTWEVVEVNASLAFN